MSTLVLRWKSAALGFGVLGLAVLMAPRLAVAAEPVALRVESLMIPPSSRPVAYVDVKNLRDVPYRGSIALKVPEGWQVAPPRREVSLAAGQFRRVPFAVQRGVTTEANLYPVEVSATGAGATVVRQQNVACTSAPYFKPTIDGDPGDWKDAIAVTFITGGRKTVVRTYWNRRQFSLLVAVEEDKLIGYRPGQAEPAFLDAVQVAISPADAKTGTSPQEEATRFEFLFVASADGAGGRCFQLAAPGMKLAAGREPRGLEPLELGDAEVAIGREDGVTYYECSVPFRLMRERIRPSEGREFCMSLLVHDPDGTGIRDWGLAAGLWPWQRNRLAWSRWPGAEWAENPPFDNKLHWALCSSKY